MALVRTNYTKAILTSGGVTSLTTASFTPPNNSLLVIIAAGQDDGSGAADGNLQAITSTPSLSWTKKLIQTEAATTFGITMTVWTAVVTTGVATTVTLTSAAGHNFQSACIFPMAYTGYDTTTPTGVTAGAQHAAGVTPNPPNPQTPWSYSLSGTSQPSSEVLAMCGGNVNGSGAVGQTIGSGWTAVDSSYGAPDYGFTIEAKSGAITTIDWAGILDSPPGTAAETYFTIAQGIAIEIRAAAALTSRVQMYSNNTVQTSKLIELPSSPTAMRMFSNGAVQIIGSFIEVSGAPQIKLYSANSSLVAAKFVEQ